MEFLPARWIPLLYLGFAHISLATAFAVIAADPSGVTGFYYHPRLVAVVHMVTLGWISSSILGAPRGSRAPERALSSYRSRPSDTGR